MQIRRCDQEYATGTFSLSFKEKVAYKAVVAHVLATFHRMFWTNISACFGCIVARVSDVQLRMFWLHFSARFGRKGAHVVPPSALVPLHGSWAPLVAVVTPLCAAGPYRWSMGDPAHTATYRVNVRMKGPRHPPIRRSRLSGCRALMSATHGVAGPHDPYCIDIQEQKAPQIREAPTVTSGRFAVLSSVG